jgi:hypothetical protein
MQSERNYLRFKENTIAPCRRYAWLIDGLLDWMIGFIDTLYIQLGTTGNSSATAISALYSSPLHMHYNSQSSPVVSWQRIYKSHCHFKSHTKSSLHLLIPFLPLICNYQFRRLDSIQFLCTQAHILAGWGFETQLTQTNFFIFFITPPQWPRKKIQPLYCWKGVYSAVA